MDYRITDHYADPVGMTERYHTEKLVRLPECFSCFRPPNESLEVGSLPAVKNGYVTFGSFNIFAKVTPQVIQVWSEILNAVPGSRLLLKTTGLNEKGMRETLYQMFADLGISRDRIDLLGKDPSRRDHFKRYNDIDIGLDPFPYNGTTTTCDALWMGVPVITLEGKTHVSRVGVSQMNNLGLTELIAKTEDEYIEIAKRLSGDLNHLSHLREGMRTRMIASPLMDEKRFTQNLEEAYREMWEEYVFRDSQKRGKSLKALENAQALFREGPLDEAGKFYQDVLIEDSQNIDALHDLGIIAFQKGNFQTAAEYFIKALTIKPDYPVAQNNLGVAFYELGLRKEAKVCYETALALKPDYAEAHNNLGILFRNQGSGNEAMSYFQKAVELKSDYTEARKNLEELNRTFIPDQPKVETKSHLVLQQNLCINKMRIGFYIQWPKGSLSSRGNVLGDELIADSMCRTLLKMEGVDSCELYAPNYLPDRMLDAMVYMNETAPQRSWAKRHFLYMQNAYNEGSEKALKRYQQIGYDGYAFISNRLLEIQRQNGLPGIFLPFGVDTEQFSPKPKDARYAHDVSYVGNDIKGEERTLKYLYPAVDFNFGLYGTWLFQQRPYQIKFASISKGKIPQEDVPILYSSSKINLNCTAQDCVDWDVITLRTLEVLACKGFLITDRVPIAEHELKDCVVFTDGGEDLRKKIAYYLERPEERERIAQNGYEYVLRNASITSRMKYFLSYLKDPGDFQKTGL
jgi:spore maturation protein CgeB